MPWYASLKQLEKSLIDEMECFLSIIIDTWSQEIVCVCQERSHVHLLGEVLPMLFSGNLQTLRVQVPLKYLDNFLGICLSTS